MSTATKLVLLGAALVVAGGLLFYAWRSPTRSTASAPRPSSTPAASQTPAGMLRDPLAPERLVRLDQGRALPGDWVTVRPAFQASRPAAQRNGIEPCATQAFDASG